MHPRHTSPTSKSTKSSLFAPLIGCLLMGFTFATLPAGPASAATNTVTINTAAIKTQSAAAAHKKLVLAKKRAKASAARKSLIKLAKQNRGIRYRFGGTSPRTGFDCSGFTKYTFGKAVHMNLPHSANAQSKLGRRVSAAHAKPGDLVVYSEPGNRNFHVGIYLNSRQIIHAKQPGSVTQIGNLHWGRTTVQYIDVIDPRMGV